MLGVIRGYRLDSSYYLHTFTELFRLNPALLPLEAKFTLMGFKTSHLNWTFSKKKKSMSYFEHISNKCQLHQG